jgi:hypothetical protein
VDRSKRSVAAFFLPEAILGLTLIPSKLKENRFTEKEVGASTQISSVPPSLTPTGGKKLGSDSGSRSDLGTQRVSEPLSPSSS